MSKKKSNIKIGYLLSVAFRNILNHKRHMFIIIFGFVISISILLSINIWAQTSENLAITDFLESQDYQAYIISTHPEDLADIMDDLDNTTIVEDYDASFESAAIFNIGNKSSLYTCLPEDSQTSSDPVSITNALICNQETLDRIEFVFKYEGNFTLGSDGILLSLHQKEELESIFHRDINIGDVLNLSIGKDVPRPETGEVTLESFKLTAFTNFTVKGIYTVQEGVSIIQSVADSTYLSDSIIFPFQNLSQSDISSMITNEVPYIILVRFDKNMLIADGLDTVVDKMYLFSEEIKSEYPYSYIFVMDAPILALINSYSRAAVSIVFMIPVILVGIILTVFTINIAFEYRQNEVALLRDRGADTIQILLIFIFEYVIVALIGIVVGIILSILFAALIPSFSDEGFSREIFVKFIMNLNYSHSVSSLVSLAFLFLLITYTTIKIWWEISLKHRNAENGKSVQKKMERNIFLGINIGTVAIIIIALIIALVETLQRIHDTQNFTMSSTTISGYTFVLFCFLLVFVAQLVSFLINNRLLSRIKKFYRRLLFNDAFFLLNSFKRKDKKLSSMSFALVFASSIIVFSLISASSVALNQSIESDFKNGVDLRINTFPIDYQFKNNISQIDGVNEVLPVFKTTGAIAYDDYTVYGVDPVMYSRVGKWDDSCFPEGSSYSIFQDMESNHVSVIIGSKLSERLNLTIGDRIPITGLPGNVYSRIFEIVGILNSAPALGLTDGSNIEMSQPNDGIVLINQDYMINDLDITTSQLFLASILPGEDLQRIEEDVRGLLPNINVNPEQINAKFIGSFIDSYIPSVQTFFYIQLAATGLIIIVLMVMFTEFTLSQRTKEVAISISMGRSRKDISRLLLVEVIMIVLTSSIGGILLGILFTYSTFYLITPILTSHNIIPFTIEIPLLQIVIFPVIMTFVAIIGVLPSIIKHGRQRVILALRG
ncbi:MAG: FtsX-like permease family protein [Asgard group archaeon]|nr:FtsX-like permease family protein [Asgard group archaeon]